jgi:dTDP-4-dehydrorhamnose reductase
LESNEVNLDLKLEVENFIDKRFDCAVICAGITNINYCQENQDEAKLVNFTNTIRLIDMLIQNGSHVIFLSTNLVFSGEKAFSDKDDSRKPKTIYGNLKKQVEDYLIKNHPTKSSILRLTKVLPANDSLIYLPWQNDVVNGNVVNMFTNIYISPVRIEEVADVLGKLIISKRSGVFQLGGAHEISNFEFAMSWASQNDLNTRLIKPSLNYDPIRSQHNSLFRVIP